MEFCQVFNLLIYLPLPNIIRFIKIDSTIAKLFPFYNNFQFNCGPIQILYTLFFLCNLEAFSKPKSDFVNLTNIIPLINSLPAVRPLVTRIKPLFYPAFYFLNFVGLYNCFIALLTFLTFVGFFAKSLTRYSDAGENPPFFSVAIGFDYNQTFTQIWQRNNIGVYFPF